MNVVVYTTPTCPYCHQVKEFLSQRGVKFTEYDVSRDRAAADEMIRKSGQMGVPVTTVGDQVVVGFDRARLQQLLADSGKSERPYFGLQIADASKIAQRLGLVPVFGAFIGKVAPSSPGEKAGLRQGDIITELNFRPIHNADDLENALSALTVGSRAVIVFLRGQNTLKSEIII
jgi:glutaredoxin-like YruB-family protein